MTIALFTDFGISSPYVGQMRLVLAEAAPNVAVVDLFHQVPAFRVEAAAHLLWAYGRDAPVGTIFVAVVDPGVGSAERLPMMMLADGRWYVGPDNGLMAVVAARAAELQLWRIDWQPPRLSATFHGRDLFAPVAALLSLGIPVPSTPLDRVVGMPVGSLCEVIYVDPFGNLITALHADDYPASARLVVSDQQLPRRLTFSDMAPGEPFCYSNSSGLLEIAVNQGDAARQLGVGVGAAVQLLMG